MTGRVFALRIPVYQAGSWGIVEQKYQGEPTDWAWCQEVGQGDFQWEVSSQIVILAWVADEKPHLWSSASECILSDDFWIVIVGKLKDNSGDCGIFWGESFLSWTISQELDESRLSLQWEEREESLAG